MWFLRAIEQADGDFACHRGVECYDSHGEADSAVAHLIDIADSLGSAIVFIHHRGGRVEEVARVGLGEGQDRVPNG
jgi:hypothetical protein